MVLTHSEYFESFLHTVDLFDYSLDTSATIQMVANVITNIFTSKVGCGEADYFQSKCNPEGM